MKKLFCAFSILFFVIFAANFSEASPKDDLNATYAQMKNVKNGRLAFSLTGHLFNKESKLTINADFSLKPKFAAVGDMKLAKKNYSFFIEDSYDKYILHYKEKKDKTWKQNSFKKEDFDRNQNSDMKIIDKLRHPEGHTTDSDSVEFKSGKYFVKLDPNKAVTAITDILKNHGKDVDRIERIKILLGGLSPITAEIRSDNGGFVREGKLELTPLLKEIKEKIASDDKTDKKTKRVIDTAFSDATIKFTFSDLNNTEVRRPLNE